MWLTTPPCLSQKRAAREDKWLAFAIIMNELIKDEDPAAEAARDAKKQRNKEEEMDQAGLTAA